MTHSNNGAERMSRYDGAVSARVTNGHVVLMTVKMGNIDHRYVRWMLDEVYPQVLEDLRFKLCLAFDFKHTSSYDRPSREDMARFIIEKNTEGLLDSVHVHSPSLVVMTGVAVVAASVRVAVPFGVKPINIQGHKSFDLFRDAVDKATASPTPVVRREK